MIIDFTVNGVQEGSRVYSMSALQTYERCPKKFQLEYLMGWEDAGEEREALTNGKSFHKVLQSAAHGKFETEEALWPVAKSYMMFKPLPAFRDIANIPGGGKATDEPVYVDLKFGTYLRCSFDLVYVVGETLVVRDYKTFSRAPSFNIDLDFQGRTYLAVASVVWPGYKNYKFEHEMVRNEAPGTAHGTKPIKYWTEEECYFHHSMVLSKEEMRDDWNELMDIVTDADNAKSFRRRPQKGGGYLDCNSCSVKQLCIADKQGNLDEQTLKIIGRKRDAEWTIQTT